MRTIKSKWQKLVIAFLVVIMLFNVVFPPYSRADFGGTLFEPIAEFICGVGDAIMNILQTTMLPGAPKAVETRTVGDLLSDELVESDNWIDKAKGWFMKFEGAVDNIPVLGDIYRGGSSFLKAFNPIGMVKGTVKNVKDMGPLALLGGGILGGFREAKDNYEGYYELYRETTVVPLMLYGPAAIFSNLVPALDVNFINPHVGYKGGSITFNLEHGKWERGAKTEITSVYTEDTNADEYVGNIALKLQATIAKWYLALRNIAVVMMLSVLVYVGIRIILSSTAGETAKYKTLLKDWLVGMCLLFTLHYMMAFILKGAEMVTDLFSSSEMMIIDEKDDGVMIDPFLTSTRLLAVGMDDNIDDQTLNEMKFDLGDMFGYTVIYCLLVVYTIIFTWKYLKRFVYLAFLTMISPLVAFTYPIDKMKDGSAQAFNMWMKEYTYNVLIQPLHLLLYAILISAAQDFAETNLIYTVVVLGFLLEAEKIFKSLFGFNKASGGELSAAVTGGALFGTAAGFTKNMFKKLPGDKNNKKDSGGSDGTGSNSKIRMDRKADSDKKGINLGTAFGGGISNSSSSTGGATMLSSGTSGNSLSKNNNLSNSSLGNTVAGNGSMPVILGSGAAKGKYSGKLGKTTGKLGKSINNSKFGQSNIGRKTIRGVKGVGRVAGTGAKKVFTTKNGIRLAKGAASVAGAAALGTMGLAAGLASDNPEDAIKYATVGAGAGALIGSKTVGAVGAGGNAIKNATTGIRDEFEKGAYGKKGAQERANKRLDEKWKKSSETVQHYKDEYGDNWEDAMDNAMELRKRGIVDQKELDMAQKMMDRNQGQMNLDQTAAIMKASRGLTSQSLKENRKDILESIMDEVQDSNTANKIINEMRQNLE